jgi:ABC-type transport system involved in multi-copper enzyme maturation permease subunit
MTTETTAPRRTPVTPERDSFWYLVHAEWTKFRTVRGWVIAAGVTIVAIAAGAFLGADVSSTCGGGHAAIIGARAGAAACPAQPTGPGGVPVQDVFYFGHQPVTGNGTITVQLMSLTGQFIVGTGNGAFRLAPGGLQPWSKAGIIIKQNTTQGSAYAAMMVTGSNGVRMQWDYLHDTPGLAGRVSASSPRWLRLVRDGDTISGYDSADGTHWTLVGTATLPGLTSTMQAGLFAAGTSIESYPADFRAAGVPDNFGAVATGVFRHIGLSWPATGWTGTNVGGAGPDAPNGNGAPLPGTLRQRAGTITVAGAGDISPAAGSAYGGSGQSLQRVLAGTIFGLIPLIVVAALFITAEYRRRLIGVSLAAAPRRGRLLAAKAVVIGAVGFVAGLVAATLALVVGTHLLHGHLQWPVSLLTEARIVAGTGALLAVAAVLALAIGTIVRRSAPAVAIVIVVIFVPYMFAFGPLAGSQPQGSGPGGGGGWPLQITPAAALSVQQAVPQFHQLIALYSLNAGYYPLAPWAGLAVECAWAAAALALAYYLLRRRDA